MEFSRNVYIYIYIYIYLLILDWIEYEMFKDLYKSKMIFENHHVLSTSG